MKKMGTVHRRYPSFVHKILEFHTAVSMLLSPVNEGLIYHRQQVILENGAVQP